MTRRLLTAVLQLVEALVGLMLIGFYSCCLCASEDVSPPPWASHPSLLELLVGIAPLVVLWVSGILVGVGLNNLDRFGEMRRLSRYRARDQVSGDQMELVCAG